MPSAQPHRLLRETQKRNDSLLYSMLPKHIVSALQDGRRVQVAGNI